MSIKPASYVVHSQVWLEEANQAEVEDLHLWLNNPRGHLDELRLAVLDDPPGTRIRDARWRAFPGVGRLLAQNPWFVDGGLGEACDCSCCSRTSYVDEDSSTSPGSPVDYLETLLGFSFCFESDETEASLLARGLINRDKGVYHSSSPAKHNLKVCLRDFWRKIRDEEGEGCGWWTSSLGRVEILPLKALHFWTQLFLVWMFVATLID